MITFTNTVTEIEYLHDDRIDASLDQDIRALLSRCFVKPQDHVFEKRRYFREPYPHRWIVRGGDGTVIAHAGVHEKAIRAGTRIFGVGGVCEVCVHPDYRTRGLVRTMMIEIHRWLRGSGFSFAVLMGDPAVYGSSGYHVAGRLFCDADEVAGSKHMRLASAMMFPLTDEPWPEGDVYLPGPPF